MEQLGWLQIGQHQLQQDVTHGLAVVLVDGRDNELNFANLIGVFLLAVTSSIASSSLTGTGSSMWASFQSDTKQ